LCTFMIQEMKDSSLPTTTTNVELEVLAKVALKQNEYYQQEQKRKRRNKKNQYKNENEGEGENEMWLQMVATRGTSTSFREELVIQNENNSDDDDDCIVIDFEADIEYYSNEEIRTGERSWMYQTCTEFGYFPTCLDDCPFASHYNPIDYHLEYCARNFNITNPNDVYDNIQASLDHYGGKNIFANVDPGISNILTINGNVDPWSVLGLEEKDSSSYKLPIKVVDGASHHFWTRAVKDTDSLEIIQIREYIYSVVMDWLGIDSTNKVSEISNGTTSTNNNNNNMNVKDDDNDIVPINKDEIVKLWSHSVVAN